MEENILETFQAGISERMGMFYRRNDAYNQNVKKEEKLLERMAQNFTRDQMELVEEFHAAICSTTAVCELLAYRQGMRDMISLLSDK